MSQTLYSIRSATPDDVAAIHTMILELAEYEKMLDQVVATEDSLRKALFGERPVAEALIAEHDGAPAGYAIFFHNYSTFVGKPGIYLEDIYVRPALRGKGIGKGMLDRLGRLADERDCGRMEWTVLDWNKPSIDFYENLGTKLMKEWILCRLDGDALKRLGNE